MARLFHLGKNDWIICLGDVGLNYYGKDDPREWSIKTIAADIPANLFCIHGNHERRPSRKDGYKTKKISGDICGKVWHDPHYPNQYFAIDGEVYQICGKTILSIGGAYSVDKELRLAMNYMWFENEELSLVEMERIYADLLAANLHYDLILTHTCPEKWIPTDMFIGGIDQSKVSRRMEIFLEGVENITNYDHWYFGHYHGNRDINDKATMLYQEIRRIV